MEYDYTYLNQKCHQLRLAEVLRMIKKYSVSSPKILSVGCGTGIIESKFPGEVQGLDKLVPDKTLISVAQGNLEQLPFRDHAYDIIFFG